MDLQNCHSQRLGVQIREFQLFQWRYPRPLDSRGSKDIRRYPLAFTSRRLRAKFGVKQATEAQWRGLWRQSRLLDSVLGLPEEPEPVDLGRLHGDGARFVSD